MALQKGLVGHWSMNQEDTDNGKIRDRSAYDNHGTLNGGVTTGNPSPVGDSYSFDGSNLITTSKSFSKDTVTISAWAFPTVNPSNQTSYAKIVNCGSGGSSNIFIQIDNNNVWDFGIRDGSSSTQEISTSVTATKDKWRHLVLTYDGSTLNAYIDGTKNVSLSTSVSIVNSSNYNIAANESGKQHFEGNISDARLYNRALSESEITQLYNQRSTRAHKMQRVPVAQQDLVAYYPLDSSEAVDQSGSGQQTTIYQNPIYEERGGVKGTGAYDFRGNNGYIGIDNWNYFSDLSDESWTAAAWVYPNTISTGSCNDKFTGGDIFAQGGGNNDTFYFHICGGDKVGLYLDGSSGQLTSPSNTISAKRWTHVVATSDPSDGLKLYVDGDLKDTDSNTSIASSNSPVWIGGEDFHGSYFDGKVSDARVYERSLSEFEVKRLYQSEGVIFGYTRNLVGHWTMNSEHLNGGSIRDISKYRNDGQLNGNITTDQPSIIGESFDFDGGDDYVKVSDSSSLDVDTITIAAWIKTTGSSTNNMVMNKENTYEMAAGTSGVALAVQATGCSGWCNGWMFQDVGSIQSDTWTHVATTWDGDKGRAYIDGELVTIEDPSDGDGNIRKTDRDLGIGARDMNSSVSAHFDGQMSDVRVYDSVLSPYEIKQIYNQV